MGFLDKLNEAVFGRPQPSVEELIASLEDQALKERIEGVDKRIRLVRSLKATVTHGKSLQVRMDELEVLAKSEGSKAEVKSDLKLIKEKLIPNLELAFDSLLILMREIDRKKEVPKQIRDYFNFARIELEGDKKFLTPRLYVDTGEELVKEKAKPRKSA